MVRQALDAANPKMDKALAHLEDELNSLRTGRASVGMVDGVTVDYFGTPQPLKAVASITTPDAKSIAITPWDRSMLQVIEKAIRDDQRLGLNPNNDGSVIRLNIPAMTEDRRRDIIKILGQKVEECRIALRNIRHDALDEVKKLEKSKQATQDDLKFAETELNKKIDQYQAKIEIIQASKEKEIMEV
jgi:ribosome recycling factor